MSNRTRYKTSDVGVAALNAELARREWDNQDLATALKLNRRTIDNAFANNFSSKAMRIRVNEFFNMPIFLEGVGRQTNENAN
jgi:hypothetical protein